MKKKVLLILSLLVIASSMSVAYSKSTTGSALSDAIRLYKQGNYSQCYVTLEDIIKKDPANALAYYYMAMTSAQLGRKKEAISNYNKTINLVPDGNNLNFYAKKGKVCLETPDKCQSYMTGTDEDAFIQNRKGPSFTQQVRSDYEKLKLENFMREMNRSDDIAPQKFKEYKDFSSAPTNDEIVDALRTLQRAGFGNIMNNGYYSDVTALMGNPSQNSVMNMSGFSNMSPQLIQAMLTNNMTQGF